MMIAHHQGAISMAQQVAGTTTNPDVKALADAIISRPDRRDRHHAAVAGQVSATHPISTARLIPIALTGTLLLAACSSGSGATTGERGRHRSGFRAVAARRVR